MATALSNLSDVKINDVPSAEKMKFGIVVSEWNYEITEALFEGANYTLLKHDAKPTNIIKKYVPGSFELTLGGQTLAEYTDVDAIILLGCVIKGETPHFDYICQGVTFGITQLNIQYNLPFIFGVLTTLDKQQALDRAGGKYGNKGDEAAITAIKMVEMQKQLR